VLLHEPAWPRINPTARTTALADVIKMSERGQAREALEVLNRSVVEPENERDFLLAKTMCAYRAGAFEEAIELHQRLAETGLENAAVRAVVMADARLSAALRDSRAVTRDELDECAAAILSPDIPDEYLKIAAYAHSKALLTLASGDAETAMRAGLEILPGRSIVPADRAYVIAMVVIAAVRAGYLDIARKWNAKLPDWCPLRPAVDLALKIRSLDGARSPDDEDCVFAD
jgi:hypothetical protein